MSPRCLRPSILHEPLHSVQLARHAGATHPERLPRILIMGSKTPGQKRRSECRGSQLIRRPARESGDRDRYKTALTDSFPGRPTCRSV
ncbi:hypothetical protein J6590_002155 [Homalodisca vitripennis]|nr:hypothetical protein J6590_002155 [Homalodisca vitripennis]